MRLTVITGSNNALRDSLATEKAKAIAKQLSVKEENLTDPLKESPELLIQIDESQTLFDESRVIMFFGNPEALVKVLPEVSSSDTENHLVISHATFAKTKFKGATPDEIIALPAAKNPSDMAVAYLSHINGFPKSAVGTVVSHYGRELDRLPLLINRLRTQYGEHLDSLSTAQVMELAGDSQKPAPWDLTDAIDRGDVKASLLLAHRLQEDKGSAYGVMAILANHFNMMYRLAQARVTDEKAGAVMLEVKGSTYPVKKAIGNARKYGNKLEMMVRLIDKAQTDITGGSSLNSSTVLDILVSRLATH